MQDTKEQGGGTKEKRIPDSFVLKGPRINLLSPPLPQDDSTVRDIMSDSQTMQYLQVQVHEAGWTVEEARERRESQLMAQQEERGLQFSIYSHGANSEEGRASTGSVMIGFCGFRILDLESREGEFGIILHKDHWGKGLATEALFLLLQYAFDELHLQRCFAGTAPENLPMQGLFTRYGIKRISDKPRSDGKYYWLDYGIYDHEWPAVKAKMEEAIKKNQ